MLFAAPVRTITATAPTAAATAALAPVLTLIVACFVALFGFDLVLVLDHLVVVIIFNDGDGLELRGELRARTR